MEAKFTKGEWRVDGGVNGKGFDVTFNDDGEVIADYVYEESDAHLIAAAPDMYEMLEILTHTCRLMANKTPLKSEFEALQTGIERVLSKARGE